MEAAGRYIVIRSDGVEYPLPENSDIQQAIEKLLNERFHCAIPDRKAKLYHKATPQSGAVEVNIDNIVKKD